MYVFVIPLRFSTANFVLASTDSDNNPFAKYSRNAEYSIPLIDSNTRKIKNKRYNEVPAPSLSIYCKEGVHPMDDRSIDRQSQWTTKVFTNPQS